ncbi:hypothetical protein CERSUDRAFT_123346 [Gelatoporia subvermispora B]|uniref:DASH complex subunit DUO1 n=1 Tax=Ceriporiopsis subvermispora (strain B) TaxID=914234 RepID=M2QK01_CERS8|nr:hypothetical protein CERSUDRAFT_123346 [Gelatoporia subvermispora B]
MDSPNISELNAFHSGSRLLSESSLLQNSSASSSRTGHGGDDLSLSELSLQDRPQPTLKRRPFSLLAQPAPLRRVDHAEGDPLVEEDEPAEGDTGLDHTMTQEDVEEAKKMAARTREEKLQHDLFILKKLNAAFDVYKDALREAKSSTERVATQLEHTNALLDKYVGIMAKSEDYARLILDERWQGAEADEEQLERERLEVLERARREEEERLLAEQRQRERLEREEQERQEREERERLERERAASKISVRGSGVRGVRGTRASMRGMAARGVPRAAAPASSTRGRPSPTVSGSGGSSSGIARRTASSASARTTSAAGTSRIARPGRT